MAYACEDCKDTRKAVIWDDDPDEGLNFTGCWSCNEDDQAAWDDTRCPECGGPAVYPEREAVCTERDCFGTAQAEAEAGRKA